MRGFGRSRIDTLVKGRAVAAASLAVRAVRGLGVVPGDLGVGSEEKKLGIGAPTEA